MQPFVFLAFLPKFYNQIFLDFVHLPIETAHQVLIILGFSELLAWVKENRCFCLFFVLSWENEGIHRSGSFIGLVFKVLKVKEPVFYDPLHLWNPQIEVCESINFIFALKLEILQKIRNFFSVFVTSLNTVINSQLFLTVWIVFDWK